MSFESLMNKWQTLNSAVQILAALGAELRLRQEARTGDPRVLSLLREILDCIEPRLLDGLDSSQELPALALIQASLHQALEVVENPGRVPGWNYADPVILESHG